MKARSYHCAMDAGCFNERSVLHYIDETEEIYNKNTDARTLQVRVLT